MKIVKARLNGTIERWYELPEGELDEIDRQAFARWLFSVLPTAAERFREGKICELWVEGL